MYEDIVTSAYDSYLTDNKCTTILYQLRHVIKIFYCQHLNSSAILFVSVRVNIGSNDSHIHKEKILYILFSNTIKNSDC